MLHRIYFAPQLFLKKANLRINHSFIHFCRYALLTLEQSVTETKGRSPRALQPTRWVARWHICVEMASPMVQVHLDTQRKKGNVVVMTTV